MSITGEPIPGTTTNEEAKKELVDPRTISKKIDAEGRTETAEAVSEARTEARTNQAGLADREQKIQQIKELISTSRQREQQKAEELMQRLESLVVKMKGFIDIGDKQAIGLQAEIDAIKEERSALYAQWDDIGYELTGLKQRQTEIPNPRQLLEAYYEKTSTQPLSNEQKRDLLKPEVLASLTEEEYITLWRRLNPHFLSHVTRQGFRDHNGMVYHSSGLQEFHNGFLRVVEDERLLRPPMALGGLKTRDEASVKKWLGDWILGAEDETQAKKRLNNLLHKHMAVAPKYPDKTAVHFAPQIVMNEYYGGETGNEIFFLYPSDVIASQYDFAFGPTGWNGDFTKPNSDTKWNDVFVWPHIVDNPGITIDAGMVFLPDKTPVDPETGSKYASEVKIVDGKEKRVMIEDTALARSFINWGKNLDSQSPFRQALARHKEEKNYWRKDDLLRDCFIACTSELQGLGFSADNSALLADKLMGGMYWIESYDEERLQEALAESGAHWKRAENTIPAKDYWEGFFVKNPHLRPKHIQYYDGDPTTAVLEFQQKNNIGKANTSKTDGQLLGFDDHRIMHMEKDPRSNAGYDELVETANKIIAEHFRGVSTT